MTAAILTLNAGSSSVKFQMFGQDAALPRLGEGGVSAIGTAPVFTAARDGSDEKATIALPPQATQEDAVRTIIDWVHGHDAGWEIVAVAHRIVHGGAEFTAPARVTDEVLA